MNLSHRTSAYLMERAATRAASVIPVHIPDRKYDEDAIHAAMMDDAAKMKGFGQQTRNASEKPSKAEAAALIALHGAMTSAQVGKAVGKDAKGVGACLARLRTKGFVQSDGKNRTALIWRATRKGRKWKAKQ